METRTTLRAGDRGTRKHVERYGKRLVCVRYRYDAASKRRYTTVELIVAEAAWEPKDRKPRANRPPQHKVWELPWGVVRGLGIEDRVVPEQPRGI